jgi:hypothetical protein
MARPTLHFTRTAIATAIAGARQGGVEVAKIEIAPDGTISVTTTAAVPEAAPPPEDEDPALRAAIEKVKRLS